MNLHRLLQIVSKATSSSYLNECPVSTLPKLVLSWASLLSDKMKAGSAQGLQKVLFLGDQ